MTLFLTVCAWPIGLIALVWAIVTLGVSLLPDVDFEKAKRHIVVSLILSIICLAWLVT